MKYFYIILSILVIILLGVFLLAEYGKNDRLSKNSITTEQQETLQAITVARQKGAEAMIESMLGFVRSDAESISYDVGSYLDVCKNGLINTENPKLKATVDQIIKTTQKTDQKSSGLVCYSSDKAYAVSLALKSTISNDEFKFCVDNNGYNGVGIADLKTISCLK